MLLVACGFFSADAHAQTEVLTAAQRQLSELEASFTASKGDYSRLLQLRVSAEDVRDRLRARVAELEPRKAELAQRATQLGPKPQGDEAPALADQRRRLTEAQAQFDADYKQTLLAVQQAEGLVNSLTEMRRTLFSTRLLMYERSILDPAFWHEIFVSHLPDFVERSEETFDRWRGYVEKNDTIASLIALAASGAAILAGAFWVHGRIVRRRRALETDMEALTQGAVLRRAALMFAMRTAPLALCMVLFNIVVRRLDAAPVDFDDLLTSIALGFLVVGGARGAMGGLLSPHAPEWRIVQASDETARVVYRMVCGAIDLYTIGIVFTCYQSLIDSRVAIEMATIIVLTIAMIGLAIWGLRRLAAPDPDSPVHGFVVVNFGWARAITSLACVVSICALLLGYLALAGFVGGRTTLSAGTIAVALLIVTLLDHAFDQRQFSETDAGRSIASSMGMTGHTLDIFVTAMSGITRMLVIVTAGLIVIMPWGLRYGDVNPFADFANFVTTTDLRNWLGSFGFGILAFVVGLVSTRIIVGWLDSSLLPRTTLDSSVRNSVRTVLGYAGFAATTLIALSLMGINAQNVTIVAGALSVGIGFGLQSIVSNFVSGLIVLAERPVRVGDVIVVKGEEGRVERISVRSTLIATPEKSSLIVPNSELISSVVRNRTLVNPTQQLRFTIVLDHDADAARAHELIIAAAQAHPNVLKQPPPQVYFLKLTDVGLEFEVRADVDTYDNMTPVRSTLHYWILQLFRENGIRIANAPTGQAAPVAAAAGG